MGNQNNEKIEINNEIRLLIFDDKINFDFLNMFLYTAYPVQLPYIAGHSLLIALCDSFLPTI